MKLPTLTKFHTLTALSFLLASFHPFFLAQAQDWKFSASPYAWLAGIEGDITTRGRTLSVDRDFSDIIENTDFGALGRFEATNDSIILTTDLTYIDLGSEAGIPKTDQKLDVDMKQTILELGGGYHLGTFGLGNWTKTRLHTDLLAGARYFNADTTIEGPLGRDPELNLSYWEPYIGPRLNFIFNDHWVGLFRTDIGGWGWDDAPDFSWQLTTGVQYRYSEALAFELGYKFLNIYDLKREGVTADMQMTGLALGTTFSF